MINIEVNDYTVTIKVGDRTIQSISFEDKTDVMDFVHDFTLNHIEKYVY